jgi:hypothetical protein
MPWDIFISYSRRDNTDGRVTQIIKRIQSEFEVTAGRPLKVFYDKADIIGMQDWRHRLLQGLRESRLLVTCISPAYLSSEYCEWEFNEYLKHEVDRAIFGNGVAPIYLIDVPGWQASDFEHRSTFGCASCVDVSTLTSAQAPKSVRRWVNDEIRALTDALRQRLVLDKQAEQAPGNVEAHNTYFVGRAAELRRLREFVSTRQSGGVDSNTWLRRGWQDCTRD